MNPSQLKLHFTQRQATVVPAQKNIWTIDYRLHRLAIPWLAGLALVFGLIYTLGPRPVLAQTDVCFVETGGDNSTDFQSSDAGAVQNAVDAAAAGSTLKIAGACAGVTPTNGISQTVYITKSLTLQGGYTNTNWLVHDPDSYPTTLDAQDAGRVVIVEGAVDVSLDHLTLTGGLATTGTLSNDGGGIHNSGNLSLSNSIVSASRAPDDGGGLYSTGSLIITASTIENNRTTGNNGIGGGIANGGGLLSISGSTIENNRTAGSFGSGGGIYNNGGTLSITGSTIGNNRLASPSADGGGLYNGGGSIATIDTTTVFSNASRYGGGIYNAGSLSLQNSLVISNSGSGDGGGILTWGVLTMTNSTLAYNIANDDGGGLNNLEQATLINSTISHNLGRGTNHGVGGGAIYQAQDGPTPVLTLVNSTVVSNTSNVSGKDGIHLLHGSAVLSSSLIAANGTENCSVDSGSFSSDGYNLDDGDTCGLDATGDITNTAAQLGPLTDNGGPTAGSGQAILTHALLDSSPAVDQILAENCTVSEDQREFARPQNELCDIGAFELQQTTTDVYLPVL